MRLKIILVSTEINYKSHDNISPLGRKVAIDASMSLYQFLIAVRQEGQMLTSDTGETTRYIIIQ